MLIAIGVRVATTGGVLVAAATGGVWLGVGVPINITTGVVVAAITGTVVAVAVEPGWETIAVSVGGAAGGRGAEVGPVATTVGEIAPAGNVTVPVTTATGTEITGVSKGTILLSTLPNTRAGSILAAVSVPAVFDTHAAQQGLCIAYFLT